MIEIGVGAFDGRIKNGLRRGHRCALDLLDDIRREGGQHLRQLRSGGSTTGHTVALAVPRLGGLGLGIEPCAGGVDKLFGLDDLINQAGFECLLGAHLLTGSQYVHQGILDTEHANDAGDSAAARQQAESNLRQANLGALSVGCNAVVAGEGDFEAATEGCTIDGSNDGNAGGFDTAQIRLHTVHHVGEVLSIFGTCGNHGLDVATSEEGLLCGGDDNALDFAGFDSFNKLVGGFGQCGAEGVVHGVDRLVRVIHGEGENAGFVELPPEHVVRH